MIRENWNLNNYQAQAKDTAIYAREIGDVLWYCALLADDLGYTLQQIAEMNISKLKSRMASGNIQGSGDNR